MTLPRFLDCAYVLLFDEYQRLGHDLVTTSEKLSSWGTVPEKKAEENVAAKNTQALQELQSMISGTRRP
jgi:hypothetical protein